MDTSVHVSVVLPGPMDTNGDVHCRLSQKQGRLAKAATLSPAEVAKIILDESSRKQGLIIPGLVNKFYWLLMKIIPLGLGVPFLSDIYRRELSTSSDKVTINRRQLVELES